MNIAQIMYASAKLTLDLLSDRELAILNNVANFPEYDVTTLEFYAKVKPLFTEQQGKKMHSETQRVLDAEVIRRLA